MTRKHTLTLAAAGTIAIAGTGAALAAGIRHSEPSVSVAGAPASYSPQRSGWPGGGARGFFGARGPGFGARGFGGGLLQAAASYLGVPVSTLLGDLRGGQSLADVAGKTSGKSADELVQTLVDQQKAQLDKAVAAGRLSQAQEDKLTANLQQRISAFVTAKPPATPAVPPRGRGFGLPGFGVRGFGGGLLQAAASYLGVPVSTLLGDLRGGQSLADVAGKTSGKSADELVQTLVDQQKAQLDKAVAAGRLSQAQEDKLTASLQQRISAFVTAKPPATPAVPPRGRGFGLPGGGFRGGRHGGWGTPTTTGSANA